MSSKRKKAEPKGDKYADKRDAAHRGHMGPDAVNRRAEARQRELDKQQRSAHLLGDALNATQAPVSEIQPLTLAYTDADIHPISDPKARYTSEQWLLINIFGSAEMRWKSLDAERPAFEDEHLEDSYPHSC